MVRAGFVSVANIHPSRTWMLFWVFAVECICAQTGPRFILLSERIVGNGVRTHVNSKGKVPSTRWFRGGCNSRCCIMQDSEPNTLLTELFQPHASRGDLEPDSRSQGCLKAKTSAPIISQSCLLIWMEFGILLTLNSLWTSYSFYLIQLVFQGREP